MKETKAARTLGLATLVALLAAGCGDASAAAGGTAAASAEVAAPDHAAQPTAGVDQPELFAPAASPDAPVITVYATPTCGCCKAWMEHMSENGFTVQVVYQDDLSGIRREKGVPAAVTSCHMGVVDGYVVEGHVPADVVTRILRERPDAVGLAVPGMPAGSPGMEMPNGLVQPYEVYTFDATGPQAVYEYRH